MTSWHVIQHSEREAWENVVDAVTLGGDAAAVLLAVQAWGVVHSEFGALVALASRDALAAQND